MNKMLSKLASEEFALEVGFLLPPPALRRRLQRLAAVRRVELAVREGAITEAEVRAFAEEQTKAFQPGLMLPGEFSLAALAVALQFCPQDFAEQYLCNLACLRLSELGTAIRVAQECLTARHTRPKNEVRRFVFSGDSPTHGTPFRVFPPRPTDKWPAAGSARYSATGV